MYKILGKRDFPWGVIENVFMSPSGDVRKDAFSTQYE
jgi:hypothetical protein